MAGPYPGRVRSRTVARVGGRAVAAALLACVALLVGAASPAGAHATLIGTAPAADGVVDAVPEVVELRFDEPVETVEGAVQVFGPDGERVDLGTVETDDGGATLRAPIDADAQGTFTVAWRVTSEDSHTLSGSFVFHNGTRTGAVAVADGGSDTTTSVAGGIGRWLGFAGSLAAVGAAALAMLLPRRQAGDATAPAGHATDPIGDGGRAGTRGMAGTGHPLDPGVGHTGEALDAGTGPTGEALDPGTRHTGAPARPGGPAAAHLGAGGGTMTIATPAVALQTAAQPGRGAASARLRTLTVTGALVGAAGALLALVAALAETAGRGLYDAIALVPDLAPDTRTGQLALLRVALGLAAGSAAIIAAVWRRSPLPALVLAAGALATASFSGHAWTAPDRWVAVTSDIAHLGAVAVWVGGLVALLAALPLVPGADGGARLATRFSGLAAAAVAIVAVSGTVSGWQQVRTLDALTSTAYGRLLLAKVAGFAVLVALGWVNRSRLVPLVERTVAPLQRSLRIETLVAGVVLALTAALIHQPPARTATSAEPFDTTVTAESGEVVDATVDPATVGANDIHLYFFTRSGTEPLAVDAVQVTAGTADVPPRRLRVTPVSVNHVTVAGASLPSAGTWTVEVTAVQAGEPLVFTFEVPIA
jgi:copper transport protein